MNNNNLNTELNSNKEVSSMYILPVNNKILKLVKRMKGVRKDEKIMIRISKNYIIIFNRYMITKTYYFAPEEFLNNLRGKDFEIIQVKERKIYLKEIENIEDIEEFLRNFLKEGIFKYFKKRKTKLIEDALLASYELANREYILNLEDLKMLDEFYEGSYVISYLNEAYIITDLNNDNYINTYTIISTLKVSNEDYYEGNFKFFGV